MTRSPTTALSLIRFPLGALLAATLSGALGAGCIVVDDGGQVPSPDVAGDIAFSWSFAGEPSCDAAGVDEIDLVVLQGGEVVYVLEREPCVGGGLVLTDFVAGRYEVEVDAYDRESVLRFAGAFSVRVEGGRENDVGVVVLASTAPTVVAVGDVALFWSFRYPAADAISACARAGVDEVTIELMGPQQQTFTERFDCDDEGAVFSGLAVGAWRLRLTGVGVHQGEALELYRTTIETDVLADNERDLGDVVLDRVESAFASVRVAWSWASSSCATEGVDTVDVRIVRDGLAEPEDVASVPCIDGAVTRSIFVPASYTITVTAPGTTTTSSSSATVAMPPGQTTSVPVILSSTG
jgi:hypothetical protein